MGPNPKPNKTSCSSFDHAKDDRKNKKSYDNRLKIQYKATTTEELATRTYQPAAHVCHDVSWAKYMDQHRNDDKNSSKIQLKILEQNKDAFTLNNCFSEKE